MAPRTAIFYAEHPLALLRDFPTDREQVEALRSVEQALARAAEDDPLAFQAYRVRRASRERGLIGIGECAARVLAWRQASIVVPELPPAPR